MDIIINDEGGSLSVTVASTVREKNNLNPLEIVID